MRVSWFGLKTKVDGFPSLGLKTDRSGLVIWTSKSPRRFLGLSLKTKRDLVCRLCHKTEGRRSVRDTSRSSILLRHEVSLARVFQSSLKTGGGATMGGTRGIIAEVVSN
jgi:hypothetical protein